MLSTEQIQRYRRDGYIAVPDLLDQTEVEELRRVTDEFVEASRNISDHTDVYDLEPGHKPDAPRVRRIKGPNLHHKTYDATLRHPRILECVCDLLGPAVRYQSTKLNMKSPSIGSPVEWHQDWAFYPHTNDDVLAVGVCIDAMTEENGALMIIPGSHTGPILEHHQDGVFVGAVTEELDLHDAVPVLVPAGGISIHHARVLHGSRPNVSAYPRRLLLMEIAAVDAFPVGKWDGIESFDARILRGEPTLVPRVEPVPVRIPEPKPAQAGSIYRLQESLAKRTYQVPGT